MQDSTQTNEAEPLAQSLFNLAPSEDAFRYRLGDIVCNAIDYVLDGENSLDELEACEKSYIGTKIEKKFLKGFGLPYKTKSRKDLKLDTIVDGTDLDLKFTLGQNWMIPPEAVNEWCLLIRADHPRGKFSAGLLQMTEDNLTKGGNRDGKRTVCKDGKSRIHWLVEDGNLGE